LWLQLQRTIGNHQVGELLRRTEKTAASPVDDRQEQALAPPIVDAVLRSGGETLEPGTRALFESRFGRDFGHVRVHRDIQAARSAEAVGAVAYTVGHHIVFGGDRFEVGSVEGKRLLAHELAHTVQQEDQAPGPDGIEIAESDSPLEREGEEIAKGSRSPRQAAVAHTPGAQLLRQPAPGGTPPTPAVRLRIGPVVWGQSEAELARRRRVATAAEQRYSIIARTYIDSAFQWALAGERIAVAQVDDPVAKENFYRALAGNMVWAATSIFATWNPVVIPMSFIGAAVGSGAAAEESALPRGEELLLRRWATEADQLESASWDLRVRAAQIAASRGIAETDYEALDRTLWEVMFPTIRFEERRRAILELAQVRVQRALSGFIREFRDRNQRVNMCIARRLPPAGGGGQQILDDARKACEEPFEPTLDFGLEVSTAPGPRDAGSTAVPR
jgi:hypothetical protein